MKNLIDAALLYGQGQRAKAKANLDVYFTNPAGIGEHPDVVQEIINLIKEVAEWDDFIETANLLQESGNSGHDRGHESS